MSTQAIAYLSAEKYLELERAAEFRSEYLNGEVFAMAGTTRNHARIAGNTFASLLQQVREGGCEVAASELRLHIEQHKVFTYPDIVVTCGPDRYVDHRRDTILDATLIVEVLSPSTRSYDRGEKFVFYRSLPSFSEYLLIAQDTVLAEHHVKQPDGSWVFREHKSAEDEIALPSIGCHLNLGSLYERVEFQTAEA